MNGTQGAATQELIQSRLSFSVRSVLVPGVFLSLNRITAERSWALYRTRQVKRPRSWHTGVHFEAGTFQSNSVKPTQPAGQGSRRGRHVPAPFGGTSGARSSTEQETARAPSRELEGASIHRQRVLLLRLCIPFTLDASVSLLYTAWSAAPNWNVLNGEDVDA